MINFLKKGISTPIALGIILVLAILSGGVTYWQYSEMQKEEFGGEISIPEKVVGDEIANWKTYRNKEYGYEIKYPEEWYFLEDNCCPPPPVSVNFNNYSDKKEEFSRHQLEEGIFGFGILCLYGGNLDEINEIKLLKEEGTQHEFLRVNESEAIRFTRGFALSYYIAKNGSVCRITFSDRCIACNQILSTFRFSE